MDTAFLLEDGSSLLLLEDGSSLLLLETSSLNYGNVVAGSNPLPVGVNSTYFYARFTGYIVPPTTGLYTIGVNNSDGCNLFIGGQTIFSNLTVLQTAHSSLAFTNSGTINLTAGIPYPIILEWQHGGGSTYQLQLAWTPPLGSIQLIPTSVMTDETQDTNGALDGTWWNGTANLWYPTGSAAADLAGPGVIPGGSIAPASTTAMTYTSTSSSITINWSNFFIYQVSGQNLGPFTGSQTITGLAVSTTYSFFPYYNPQTGTINFVTTGNVANLQTLAGISVAGSGYVTTTTSQTITNSSTHVSVEMWVYPTSGTGDLLEIGNNGGPSIQLGAADGSSYQLSVNGSSGASGTIFGGTLTPNFWNHVVVVFNYGGGPGGSLAVTMYVNGVQSTGSQSCNSSSGTWQIAGYSGGSNGSGVFSRVAIYNSTLLTQAQVTNHLNTMIGGGTGAYDALVASDGATYYWKLVETSGTTAADSIDSNTGTYTGTYTQNVSDPIGGANGTPSIAWQLPPVQVTMAQFLQQYVPLSAGGLQFSTTASGSGGGTGVSFYVPGLPSNLVLPI